MSKTVVKARISRELYKKAYEYAIDNNIKMYSALSTVVSDAVRKYYEKHINDSMVSKPEHNYNDLVETSLYVDEDVWKKIRELSYKKFEHVHGAVSFIINEALREFLEGVA